MSNGIRCCILGPCCPPPPPAPTPEGSPPLSRVSPKAIAALAKELEEALGLSAHKNSESTGNGMAVAEFIFEHYDLVPAGVGTAIVNAYGPEFAKKYAHHEQETT